ncbi:hypothetical protein ACFX15_027974 [Malus domestica]|uniref:basic leucine zipper 24-like n=1 Tax=Malus domestica TaxID=3750 RepID=UPI0010A9B6D1|nr:basic leucine zipper 24-like [Malus domestica]XP_028952234.1 basic leucine zipper 24-like [Malus domestica]XP_028952236.1 basic leucine zipper 24-like [Malus domestica]
MDDGEVVTSDHALLPNPNSSSTFHGSTYEDTFFDEFLKTARTCTHTHTCNPPGPDAAHTHTCYHTHTQILSSEDDDGTKNKDHSIPRPRRRRPSGNREAVRKYREKKKAHTAYLEEEVKKLQVLNQQLVRKLQGQAILEAERLRLRGLLLEFRGKIDTELGVFPFGNQCNSNTYFEDSQCNLQSSVGAMGLRCQTDLRCFCPPVGSSVQASIGARGETTVPSGGNCQPAVIDCRANTNEASTQAK